MNLFETRNVFQRIDDAPAPLKIEEEDYYEALEVVPPIYLKGASWFAMGEVKSHRGDGEPIYYCFARIAGEFFGMTGTRSEAEAEFTKMAEKEKARIKKLYDGLTDNVEYCPDCDSPGAEFLGCAEHI